MSSFNPQEFQNLMSKETDPDLMIVYEIVKLPSKGLFYPNHLSEVNVEFILRTSLENVFGLTPLDIDELLHENEE